MAQWITARLIVWRAAPGHLCDWQHHLCELAGDRVPVRLGDPDAGAKDEGYGNGRTLKRPIALFCTPHDLELGGHNVVQVHAVRLFGGPECRDLDPNNTAWERRETVWLLVRNQ
jgi:hypothetical protein